jgi:hypothetical protein
MRENLARKIDELPPELQNEVEDFVEFLREKKMRKSAGKPEFKWAGVLKDVGEEYTSVELQHKISELRAEKQ